MSKYLITSALPYINGVKHLGNLVGSMLPADVYARFLRQQGDEVLYLCGTDEHGTPAELAAQKAGKPVQAYCDEMYQVQKNIYERFEIQFDYFGRTSSQANHDITQAVYQALKANGFIEEKTIKQVYSVDDQRFLPDRYVEGTCPKCGYEKARGDQCDGCGVLLDPIELLNPYSSVSGSHNVEIRTSEHVFLNLSALEPKLRRWVESHDNWPAVTKGIAKKWLQEGLQARCISRDLSWGVPVPGMNGKVFYVWFDAPMGYISMTQELREDWLDWWKSSDVEYVQFMAKDNVPFHAIFWPAMLMGAEQGWHLADQIKGMSWLTYAGGKFSTSQGRGVFTDAALDLFPADYWRYALIAHAPEGADADFSFAQFATTVNKDLADILGNFVNRVVALICKYAEAKVPAETAECLNDVQQAVFAKGLEGLVVQLETYEQAVTGLKFRQAAQAMRAMWALANEYITEAQPWKVVKQDAPQALAILNVCLHLIRSFAIVSSPVMPQVARQLMMIVGEAVDPAKVPSSDVLLFDCLPAGQALEITGPLFAKIDDEQVDSLTAAYQGGEAV